VAISWKRAKASGTLSRERDGGLELRMSAADRTVLLARIG
jgi:hypothetical protein